MNDGVRRARCGDEADVARVHVQSWRTTYQSIVPQPFLDGLSVDRRRQVWQQQICDPPPRYQVFVAESGTEGIVGFADCGPERSDDQTYTGELYAIYLLAHQQRRGVGRALFAAVVETLRQNGSHGMLLWVLEDNDIARPFYEAMGGAVLRSQTINIGGANLIEVAYGWPDLDALATRLSRA